MTDVWNRDTHVGFGYPRWSYQALSGISLGESLLRLYVSWHFVGLWQSINEPLFVGVELTRSVGGIPPTPDDPMAGFFGLTGEWLAQEMHAPDSTWSSESPANRVVWPKDGFRIWDIKANRKSGSDERILPYLVWALPQNSEGGAAVRFTYSQLNRVPG